MPKYSLLIMKAIALAISLFVSTLAFAQVPSVKVENTKGEYKDAYLGRQTDDRVFLVNLMQAVYP